MGYGKPPEKHRFEPGTSGNPKGRPRGSKNQKTTINEYLNARVKVNTGKGVKHVPRYEAWIMRLVQDGDKGNWKAVEKLLALHLKFNGDSASRRKSRLPVPELSASERDILEEHERRIIESFLAGKKKEGSNDPS